MDYAICQIEDESKNTQDMELTSISIDSMLELLRKADTKEKLVVALKAYLDSHQESSFDWFKSDNNKTKYQRTSAQQLLNWMSSNKPVSQAEVLTTIGPLSSGDLKQILINEVHIEIQKVPKP